MTCERAFLSGLGGGCSAPVAAYAEVIDEELACRARVIALDGGAEVEVNLHGPLHAAAQLGSDLALMALARGAERLIGGES